MTVENWMGKYVLGGIVAGMTLAAPIAAMAQDTDRFEIELNGAAETEDGSCRLTYVAANRSDIALESTAFQVGIFDADGAVTRLLVLEFGALVGGKTKILQFDLTGQPCSSISRIVVNDTAACTLSDGSGESALCSTGLVTRSRTAIQFGI